MHGMAMAGSSPLEPRSQLLSECKVRCFAPYGHRAKPRQSLFEGICNPKVSL